MKLHSFPFYVDDWRGSDTVAGLTLAEEGLYLRLICAQWRDPRRSLSSALPDLARIARVPLEDFQQHWPAIAQCFVQLADGRLANRKLRHVYTAAAKFAIEKRAKAKVAAKRRWDKQLPLSFADAHALREHANLTVPVPYQRSARMRARGPLAPDDYLASCPHEPRCALVGLCSRRRELDAAQADGRLTAEQARRLERLWLAAPGPAGQGLEDVTTPRRPGAAPPTKED